MLHNTNTKPRTHAHIHEAFSLVFLKMVCFPYIYLCMYVWKRAGWGVWGMCIRWILRGLGSWGAGGEGGGGGRRGGGGKGSGDDVWLLGGGGGEMGLVGWVEGG